MARTEYKVVPAPERARKKRGLKGPALFAHEVETLMNELAAEGWIYVRADTLPHEERSGFTNKTTTYRNLLVFQRTMVEDAGVTAPVAPVDAEPAPSPAPEPPPEPATPARADDTDDEVPNLWQALDLDEETPEPSGSDRKR